MLAKWDHDGDFGPADGEVPNSLFDGDDREVRYFGHPASEQDRRSITALIDHYYAAAAAGDGGVACSMIDASLVDALVAQPGRVSATPSSADRSCATAMSRLFAHVPGRSAADMATTKVIGVRVRGSEGLALLHLRDSATRDMPVAREGGAWRVEAFFDNGLA
jgi:hypothetical protein